MYIHAHIEREVGAGIAAGLVAEYKLKKIKN
jgi:hypothetical protein